jgi:hypothetical protein
MPSCPRRFLTPWSAELTPNCFIVRDAEGGHASEKRFQKAFPKINKNLMHCP